VEEKSGVIGTRGFSSQEKYGTHPGFFVYTGQIQASVLAGEYTWTENNAKGTFRFYSPLRMHRLDSSVLRVKNLFVEPIQWTIVPTYPPAPLPSPFYPPIVLREEAQVAISNHNGWCSVKSTKIYDKGRHNITVRILQYPSLSTSTDENKAKDLDRIGLMVGVAPVPWNGERPNRWLFLPQTGEILHDNVFIPFGGVCAANDTILFRLDMQRRVVALTISGTDSGIAFRELAGPVQIVVSFGGVGGAVRIEPLDVRDIRTKEERTRKADADREVSFWSCVVLCCCLVRPTMTLLT